MKLHSFQNGGLSNSSSSWDFTVFNFGKSCCRLQNGTFTFLWAIRFSQFAAHNVLTKKTCKLSRAFCSYGVFVFIFIKLLVKHKLRLSDVDVKLVDNSSLSKLGSWISLIMLMKYLRLAPTCNFFAFFKVLLKLKS